MIKFEIPFFFSIPFSFIINMSRRKRNNAHPSGFPCVDNNKYTDEISLHIDRTRAHVGSEITGRVDSVGAPNVVVEFEGVEYTVVALPGRMDSDHEGSHMDDLIKETSQKRIFLRETRELSLDASRGFRFGIPDNVPGTIRRTLHGTNPSLPSQCEVNYSVRVMIVSGDGYDCNDGRKLSKEIFVLPKKEVNVPIDPVIGVSIGSKMEALHQTMFSWSKIQGAIDIILSCSFPRSRSTEKDGTLLTQANCIFLNASKRELNLCIGQTLLLEVNDSFRLLSGQQNAMWMLKLTEELSWEAQGRKTSNQETWNLHVNNHAIPNLTPSYDHNYDSLIQVHHTLTVYMTTEEKPTKSFASTNPIKVKIMSSRVGWDA